MPTAAKLVAGLCIALTAAIAAWQFIQINATSIPLGWRFMGGNAVVGFLAGWYALGRNPGPGVFAAIFTGIKSLVFLLIGSGMLFAGIFVLRNLERNNFGDPVELPLLWIETSFNYVVAAFHAEVVITLLIGGAVSGLLTYIANRRWD